MEASTAEAEAISAALAAAEAKSRDQNGEIDPHSPDRDRGAEAATSGKPPSSPSSGALISLNRASMGSTPVHTPPTGVRLHHRAVSTLLLLSLILTSTLFLYLRSFISTFEVASELNFCVSVGCRRSGVWRCSWWAC